MTPFSFSLLEVLLMIACVCLVLYASGRLLELAL